MDPGSKTEAPDESPTVVPQLTRGDTLSTPNKVKFREKEATVNKRRCVSTACIACRRRKSKCDGNLPKCAACASVYLTECEYAPHTDHRRKGVYKKDVDNLRTKHSTLQVLIQAILNAEEEDAFELVRQIRTCDNLEDLAQNVENKEKGIIDTPDSPIYGDDSDDIPQFDAELSSKMGDIVIDGSIKFIGGTSNLIWLNDNDQAFLHPPLTSARIAVKPKEEAILSWTTVTKDKDLILHFMNMYFCWHYAYFTTLSKELFYRDFLTGTQSQYCSSLLVNAMLTLGCHFSSKPMARADPEDSSTTGDHFFAEAKRLIYENDEFAIAKLCTVQALALMSVREAGCGRENKGWVYSGISFRMASDLGLNIDVEPIKDGARFSDEDADARQITFWGCFLFDKCWSNYLGRQPQLLSANINVKKPEVFPSEDSEMWSPFTDSGIVHTNTQPARTRAVSLQIFKLAEMSSDLLSFFYQPQNIDKPISKQNELKKLSDIHTRLEAWRKDLPAEMDAKDGQLPQVILMHMFYQLLYIHLYRPFLKYTKTTSPLPSHVSPRKYCTQAASAISKLLRLYKRTYGLRQICNIAVYIAHSACTIHLLNLPDKNARRDIIHGVKQLEEIGDCWTCARRTLRILAKCAEKWKIALPDEVQASFTRSNQRWATNEPSSAPTSPDPFTAALHEMQSRPLSDHMAQNLANQNQPHQIRHYPESVFPFTTQTAYPTIHSGPVQPLPSTSDINRQPLNTALSSNIDLNVLPNTNRPKISVQLTQAQQDAWNSLQNRMGQSMPGGTRTTKDAPPTAANLFGGIDSLIEQSQDWWYHDQSQIAMGFDNWNHSSSSDWPNMGANMAMTSNDDLAPHQRSFDGSESFHNENMLHTGGGMVGSPHSLPANRHAQPVQQQQLQGIPRLQHYPSSMSSAISEHRSPSNASTASAAQVHMMSFDEDTMY